MSDRLRIVVFDDNENRKAQIREHMPDYVVTIFCGSVEVAKKSIADADGTDLVVLNADEESGKSADLFRWLKDDASAYAFVPVLLLCEDAFSDHVLDFLDIGDAAFYEGDFDPDYFFMQVMETIDAAEMAPDEIAEPSYSEKDPDRIQGLSVKPVGEDEDTIKRSIVLQHEEQLQQLDQAIERGRQKQQKLKEIMTLALKYKEEIRKEQELQETESAPSANTGADGLHRLNNATVESMLTEAGDGRRTIVVIDNDPKNRKLCELFLQSDYRVILLSTGMSAIDYFVKATADLILISFRMPILDGLKILDSIRWQPYGKKVPVIFMTDEDPQVVKKQCQKERVVGLLAKPVQKNALRRSVDAVLATIKGQ